MTNDEAKQIKQRCKTDIIEAMWLDAYYQPVRSIDPRLVEYILDAAKMDADHANLYELLGIRKFLRMICTYDLDIAKVQKVYKAYEHLKFSGIQGKQQYKLTPMQTYQLAAPFLFLKDDRRVCTEANYFVPRKSSKTTLAAFFIFWFFFFEDYNAEAYCTANSADQSKILFRLSQDLIRQMDPSGHNIRFTATETSWYDSNIRESKVVALSAGGKTKDGLFAQLCCADEYGSAGYVKDKSDMANLVNVVEGSMGPRKEPMTVITTTAGRVQEGPYEIKLRGIKEQLLLEITVPLDGQPHPMDSDWQFALICCPDQWEESDEDLMRPELWRKVNRHIGITVQPDFYENEWKKMLLDPEKKREQITKLFNVWQTASVTEWIKPEQVRALQTDRRIDNCTAEAGWIVYAAFDFSHGDDFDAVTFLAYNHRTQEYFADCDAWVNEEAFNSSPYRPLYVKWRDAGWLHVSGKTTVAPEAPITRIMELDQKGINFIAFGYDAYQSKEPILLLKEWLFNEVGVAKPDAMVVPVSQTFAHFNAPVQKIDYCFAGVVRLTFSPSPLWPWEFANCVLEEDTRMGNKKPMKRSPNNKIDNIICLAMCFNLEESFEAK